jgi:hypothetical protein
MGLLDMLGPGGWIGSFVKTALTGPLIGGMVDGYKSKLASENTSEKYLADIAGRELMVEQRQRELDAQMNIMEQGVWYTRWPRAIVQWSVALYIAKVILWDIVLGLGSTPSLRDPLIQNAFNLIIAMWFGGRTLEKIASSVTNRIGKK